MGGSTLVSGVSSAVQGSSQSSQEAAAARYNATVLEQQGVAESNTAAANMAESERRSKAALGEQAAAFGQAGIGTGGSVLGVERQSATMSRMDALNLWYSGELEHYQAFQAAADQRYRAKIYSSNANAQLYGGIGTSLLTSPASGYGTYLDTLPKTTQ